VLNISAEDVKTSPFPHVVSEQILDPDFYKALRADYPTSDSFEDQKQESGLVGSRTGQGFDIYRGDASYDKLIAQSAAWAEFDAWINSPKFVEKFLDLFGDHLEHLGCRGEINAQKYDRTLVEGRDGMTNHATFKEKLGSITKSFRPKNSLGEIDLFTRLDIHKALKGYNKPVHCDRANRLCSFVMYFVDAEKEGIKGGQLTIHSHVDDKAPSAHERHPKPEVAPVVATMTPKENMGVLFPCSNNSYHGVTAMESNGKERDYLYINISGKQDSIW